jgi:hypothetical protein
LVTVSETVSGSGKKAVESFFELERKVFEFTGDRDIFPATGWHKSVQFRPQPPLIKGPGAIA